MNEISWVNFFVSGNPVDLSNVVLSKVMLFNSPLAVIRTDTAPKYELKVCDVDTKS